MAYGKLPDGTYAKCHECEGQCEDIRDGREEICCDCNQKHDPQAPICETCEARIKERERKQAAFDKRKRKVTEFFE